MQGRHPQTQTGPIEAHKTGGAAGPIPFHAFRRACRYYSPSLPFAAWWSPEESKDMGARARTVRVRPSWSVILYGSAQGVRKWEGWRSRRAATRATAAPRPERTNKAFDFAAWKGGVRCSDAVQPMAAWLARCGRVPVQRAARSHATVSVSPIREEFSR